jgi:alpha-D-ribose 1-methylphosphonate 5-triphosphate synthase subunit PhnI
MAYVATKGGERAIERAEGLFRALNGEIDAAFVHAIARHMPYLVDRVMGEGSLYAPDLAALALAQSGGDLYEAVLLLRAYRSTQPRLHYAEPLDMERALTVRRISAAFKDIPGGQFLGPTLDYSHRLLRAEVLDGGTADGAPQTGDGGPASGATTAEEDPVPSSSAVGLRSLPAVAAWQRAAGLAGPLPTRPEGDVAETPDVTRDPISFPAPRAHRLQSLARADTGGVLSLGYASMRGYGLTHPTVNEVRLAYADVELRHPVTGARFSAGRVRVSQGEVVSPDHGARGLKLGHTATVGWNEVKCISGAMLDMEMSAARPHPAHEEEFVLYHTEPVEASGFCIHYKLPHYVTFASVLDSLRREGAGEREEGGV